MLGCFSDLCPGSVNVSSIEFGEELEEILRSYAQSGKFDLPWSLVKKLLAVKLCLVCPSRNLAPNLQFFFECTQLTFYPLQVLEASFSRRSFVGPITESFESRRDEVLGLLLEYEYPPFTFQRICEVLLSPEQFAATHKLINGLERLVTVVSPIDD